MNKISVFPCIIFLMLVLGIQGCSVLPFDQLTEFEGMEVVIQADLANETAEIISPNDPVCNREGVQGIGCRLVPKNSIGFLPFRLDTEATQFQRIQLCIGETLAEAQCDLALPLRLEFVASETRTGRFVVPDGQGYINLADLALDLDSFFLITQNLYRLTWYYQVQICPTGFSADTAVDHEDCAWADPPLLNKGRGLGIL